MIDVPDTEPLRKTPDMHPALQFLVFAGIFVAVLLAGTLLGLGIVFALYGIKTVMAITTLDTTAPHFTAALWVLQITGTTLPIFIAPVIFAKGVMHNTPEYLKAGFRFPFALVVLVFFIMFISNPLIEVLSNFNEKMVLPRWLHWMRESEDNAQKMVGVMLDMKTVWDMISDVLFIGLLTAIVEEFMFRGVLQTIFLRMTKNMHAAVWITAVLFSAFHVEFFGFLPRLMLGVLFGYFVAWSGSIWTSVWGHFINNGSAVVLTYLFQHKHIKTNPDDAHVFNHYGYWLSLFTVLFLMFIYRRTALPPKNYPVTG